MRTYLDCIPCFFKQALEQGRLFTGNELVHKEILDEVATLIPKFSMGLTPPEMAREMHRLFGKRFAGKDLYKKIKEQSNRQALMIYPKLKEQVARSADRLLTAVELAIAGNIIDYAAKNTFHIEDEIQKILSGDFSSGRNTVFHYPEFKAALDAADCILYLADNAGEIVFDRVLLEEFSEEKEIIFAVRDKPAINDALREDAVFCEIDKVARVISSGVDAPGTILKYCSDEFLKIFDRADLIISKGQGNYEALSEVNAKIYFLFKVKCPVIARHSKAALG
ncbi:MAG: ARMT1-like domain-containing protein, partial [Candidatus Omnitrophota bacterium]